MAFSNPENFNALRLAVGDALPADIGDKRPYFMVAQLPNTPKTMAQSLVVRRFTAVPFIRKLNPVCVDGELAAHVTRVPNSLQEGQPFMSHLVYGCTAPDGVFLQALFECLSGKESDFPVYRSIVATAND
jgi:hypothetical protein